MHRGLSRQSLLIVLLVGWPAVIPARAAPPDTAPSGLYDRLVWKYMQGKWDDVWPEIVAQKKEIAALPPDQKADIESIRRALSECRPSWWELCKSGERTRIKPLVWDNTLAAIFDPTAKQSVQINYAGSEPSVVVSWSVADMDNPAEAEHGFTKGELEDLAVWSTLGTARAWTDIPLKSQLNLNAQSRQLLNQYLSFRGVVTSAYYTTPRARRWGLWLAMLAFSAEQAKDDPSVMSRRSVGALFIVEVLSHRANYPGIKLPELASEQIETHLASHMKGWLERGEFTLAQDNALRDAIKRFAETNEMKVRSTGKVVLSNGLPVSLDPGADKLAAADRDAWIKSHYPK